MLRRVAVLAFNTYRESLRARVLLGLAAVALAVSFYSLIVGAYTLHHAARVVSDVGAASVSLFSIVVAVVIGATSLHRELEQKTIFPILARPVRRGEYLVGKYLGTLLTILVFVMADAGLVLLLGSAIAGRPLGLVVAAGLGAAVALGIVAWRAPRARTWAPIPWSFLVLAMGAALATNSTEELRVVLGSAVLTLFEVAIVAAIATLFSSFSTPFLSAVLTVMLVLVGRNADDLARLPVKYFGPAVHRAGEVLAWLVPNLQVYVPPRPLLTGEAAFAHLGAYFARAAVQSVGWAVALLAVAAFIFKRRDFL